MSRISHDEDATTSRWRPAGSRIDDHRHSWHQVVYPSRGAVAVTTSAGTWITPPNRAIWIPADVAHRHRFHGDTQFHCVAVDPDRYPTESDQPTVLGVDALARALIVACSQEGDITAPRHLRRLDVLIDELAPVEEHLMWIPTPRDPRLRRACALVAEELATPMTLPRLGARIGLGERTLSRLFRTDLAMSYPQWRTQLRLHHALRLLAEGHTVTEVARSCGWATPSAFIDTFGRALGYTPGRAESGIEGTGSFSPRVRRPPVSRGGVR